MHQPIPQTHGNSRAFIACLLAFSILMTPIVAIAAPGMAKSSPSTSTPNKQLNATATTAANVVEPAMAPLAPIITATLVDEIENDDADGKIDVLGAPPNTERIKYTATITNSGTNPAATNVVFTDTIDTSTTLVAGSLNVSPLALDDTYATIGNTLLEVGPVAAPNTTTAKVTVTGSVLDNDTDFLGAPAPTLKAPFPTTSTNAGTVTMESNGRFSYTPAGNFTGTDTFTYTITDRGADDIPDNADDLTNTGTVNINVNAQKVWYVKNDVAGPGTGTSTDPFNTLAQAQTISAAGDTIYVFFGNGTTSGQNAGITLKANQRFIGEGVQLDVPVSVNGGPNPTVLRVAGSAPSITNTGGNGVTVTNIAGVSIRGFVIGGNTNAIAATFSAAGGGVTINTNTITGGSGNAIDVTTTLTSPGGCTATISNNTISGAVSEGIDINGQGGGGLILNLQSNNVTSTGGGIDITGGGAGAGVLTITGFANNSVSGASGANGIFISTATFDSIPGGGVDPIIAGTTSIGSSGAGNGVGGNGLVLINTTGTLPFTDLDIWADGGNGLDVTGLGAATSGITVGAGVGTINASNGIAVKVSGATIDLQLVSISSNNTTTGVTLGAGSAVNGTFSAGASSSITNASGDDFVVGSGTATITYDGPITSSNGNSVDVSGHTGGTVTFNGAISDTGIGISLTSNTGATITFKGGLISNTGALPAFTATGGGTVNVCDENPCAPGSTGGLINTLTTTTGTALNVNATTIGANKLEFRSISAGTAGGGPAKGISLNNTGTGGLRVTGTGTTNGSGGTIQDAPAGSTMTRGIEIINSQNISLSNMALTNANRVQGAVSDGTFGGSENTDENGAMHLQTVTNVSLTNIDINGTVQHGINGNLVTNLDIDNSTILNAGNAVWESGMYIFNLRGTSAAGNDSVFSNTTVQDTGQFNIFVQSNGSTNAHSGSTTYAGVNRANMDALTMNSMTFADSGNNVIGDHVTVFNTNGANFRTVVTNSTFTAAVPLGTQTSDSIQVDASGTAHSDFEISGCSMTGSGQAGINVSAAGTGFATFNVHDNPLITTRAGVGVNVAGNGDAEIRGFIQDNPHIYSTVVNNAGSGIQVFSELTGLTVVTVDNNVIETQPGTPVNGFSIGIRGYARQTGQLDLTVINNTVNVANNPGVNGFEGITLDAGNASAGENNTIRLNLANNSIDGLNSQDYYFTQYTPNTFQIQGLSPASGATEAQVESYIQTKDTDPTADPTVEAFGGTVVNYTAGTPNLPLLFAPDGVEAATILSTFMTTLALSSKSSVYGPSNAHFIMEAPILVTPSLNQAELDSIVSVAIERWASTGLTPQQVASLRAIKFDVADLEAEYLGSSEGNRILVDRNAQGRGWFIDPTPRDDSEFGESASTTRSYTRPMRAPAGHVDLMTAIMHEIGHRLGLDDSYSVSDRDSLMYGNLTVGERRLPAPGQASAAKPGRLKGSHFLSLSRGVKQPAGVTKNVATTSRALAPILVPDISATIPSLPAGKSVTITFKVTLNDPPNLTLLNPPRVRTQGTVTADGGINVLTDDTGVGANAGETDPTDTPVDLYDTTTAVTTNKPGPDWVLEGEAVTFTATVAQNQAGSPGTPTGTVQFLDNVTPITCSESGDSTPALTAGVATCTTTALTAGAHTINANYQGDGNFEISSGSVAQTVNACTTNPVVTTNADTGVDSLRDAIGKACVGSTITFTAAAPFDAPATITLATELSITRNLTIDGPDAAANHVTVSGGGVTRVFHIQPGKTVTIRDLTVSGGLATGANGGGIYNDHGTLTLINMTISDNAADNGGGVYNNGTISGSASLTILNSTFSGNTANLNGGSIFSDGTGGTGSATLALNNSTISGNDANGQGGGIHTDGTASTTVTTTNATITDNTADFDDTSASDNGGGLFVGSGPVVRLRNTIVAGNFRGTATPVADDIQGADVDTTVASSNNLIGTGGAGGLTNGSFFNLVGIANPGLGLLADNGGPTQTHNLLFGSPAIEAGDNAFATAVGLTTDQRGAGFIRPADSADVGATKTVDIGAIEAQATIEDIPDQSTAEDTPKVVVFNVGDETQITNVTATSSNTGLVADVNAVITGSGPTRTLTLSPTTNQFGTTTITVTVISGTESMQDTFVLTVTAVGDQPTITSATTTEDTQTALGSGLVITKPAADGAEVTHFKIGAITNGLLFKSNGTDPIVNGDVITEAEGNAGLRFSPANNLFSPGTTFSFQAQGAIDAAGNGTGLAGTGTITVTTVADTPSVTNATTNEDIQTANGFLVISRNGGDGAEVTHFKITGITNGSLFQNNGSTPIANDEFITFVQGNAGLRFTPAANLYSSVSSFGFTAQASTSAADGGLGGSTVNATITVNPIADTPSVTNATTNVNTQTASGLVISRNLADAGEVTHFKITNIQNGTLYQNNGSTVINPGDFITFAVGNAGLKFTPTAGQVSPTPFSFDIQASTSNANGGLGGDVITALITVNQALTLTVNTTGDAPDLGGLNNTCDTSADPGEQCTLRAAIQESNFASSDDTINFSLPASSTISLLTPVDPITGNVNIAGPGANTLTVERNSGATDFRIFNVTATGTTTISGLTLKDGKATTGGVLNQSGGGILFNSSGTLNIISSTLTNNLAVAGGGGINNISGGTINVTSSTFNLNSANTGGAIDNSGSGIVNVINSTLSGNTANSGAAIFNAASGTLNVTNSTLNGNNATVAEGGGISHGGGATTTVTNSTVSSNTSVSGGGGIHISAGSVTLKNTIVAYNTANSIASDVNGAVNADYSLIANDTGALITGGNNQLDVDPLLGALVNNGGPTQTRALLAGSPALDAGNNAYVVAPPFLSASPITDQRGTGFTRVTDGPDGDTTDTVDLGAFEAQVWVEDIADRSINEDGSDSFSFGVGGSAAITTVTATSSNTTLVPNNVANIAVTGSGSTRTLTINPVANLFGATTITVTVNSASGSMTDTFVFTVNPIADTPSVTNASTSEDTITAPGQLVTSRHAADGAEVTHFKVTAITNGTLFHNNGLTAINNNEFITHAQANAGLRFLPATNSTASGSFTVQAATGNLDPALGGSPVTATIIVTSVNDQPTLDPITPNPLNILEDAAAQNVNLTGITAGGSESQTLVVSATSNNTSLIPNPTVTYTSPNNTGSISFTPVADAFGTATITVTVTDNSGGTQSVSRQFDVNVASVNDAPSFTKGADQTVNEDAAAQSVLNWATLISQGPANEATQVMAFTVTNDNPSLFAVQPEISRPGTLSYTPAPNANGTATVSLTLSDNGGIANGGLDTSAVQTFSITLTAVNDAPVNTALPATQSVIKNQTLTFNAGNSNLVSIADLDAAGSAVQVTLTATNGTMTLGGTAGLTFTPANANNDGTADATMTFTGTIASINAALNGMTFVPTLNFEGAASIQIATNDQGNSGSGGPLSDTDTITINVIPGGTLALSVATYTVDEGAGTATITVTRTGGTTGEARVDFATSNGTATAEAGVDYTSTSGTLIFPDGVTTPQTFTVPIINDTLDEANETINLTLSNVTGTGALGAQTTAVLTITDNDPPTFHLDQSAYDIDEDEGHLTVTVTRGGDLTQDIRVDYATSDLSGLNACSQVTNHASQRCDYATVVGTLRFAAGQTTRVIHISVVDDVYIEGAETFMLTLNNNFIGDLGTPITATITINDNDVGPAANPIDNDAFWIRQMYIDVLGREPEPGAVNAWLAILNHCTVPTDCDRAAVALGFLQSEEFQSRGFFVYRFYAGSLGRAPIYSEFVPDHARMSGFLDVAELELNKQAYLEEFMSRTEFRNIYDPTIGNPTAYVDTLLQRAGLASHPRRTDWINGLTGGTLTRAQVLREFVDSVEVYGKLVNEAFVVMNYFGLLRRTADSQYQVWIQMLNTTGSHRTIVTGFINSPEYRLRFGP